MAKPCVIMDIDGTLSNAAHRVHLLGGRSGHEIDKAPDWKAFLAASVDDVTHPEIVILNNTLTQHFPVFICTGRSEDQREMTKGWLLANTVFHHRLYMRPAGDRRCDTIVKKEMLDQIREEGFEPLFAVEDRARVTKMWRDNGVRCLQVCEGDY